MQEGSTARVKAETALYVSVFLPKVLGELQVSQGVEVHGEQWDHGDVQGDLEIKAGWEKQDHMDQRGPKETVARLVLLDFLVRVVCQVTLGQVVSLVHQE